MRLINLDFDKMQDRSALKPKVGDAVLYEGVKYTVTEVGLKYVHIRNQQTGFIGIAKIQEVSKWIEEVNEPEKPLENFEDFEFK